jgi:hypothetical protein
MDEVDEPVLDVRRIGARFDKLKLHDITASDKVPIGVRHVAGAHGIEVPYRTYPSQTGHRRPLRRKAGGADAAQHLRHREDQDFLRRHSLTPDMREEANDGRLGELLEFDA